MALNQLNNRYCIIIFQQTQHLLIKKRDAENQHHGNLFVIIPLLPEEV